MIPHPLFSLSTRPRMWAYGCWCY